MESIPIPDEGQRFDKMNKELCGEYDYPEGVLNLRRIEKMYQEKIELREETFTMLYEYLIEDRYIPRVLLNQIVSYL